MSDLTELGLRQGKAKQASETPQTAQYVRPSDLPEFLTRLLDIMSTAAPDADIEERDELLAQLGVFREQLDHAVPGDDLKPLAHTMLATCERFLWSSKAFHASKDREMVQLISVLKGAAEASLGSSASFVDEVFASTDRFRKLTEIDDLRVLRQRLTTEIQTLHKASEDQRRRDEDALVALRLRVQELQSNLVKAEEEASIDPLTQIPNRRAFDRFLAQAVADSHKANRPLALAMLDIDHFKKINDTHGHQAGDRILQHAARVFAAAVRRDDLVARYGGEEFGVVLPGSDLANAERRLTDLIQNIASRDFTYDDDDPTKTMRFTVSCGVAQLSVADEESDLIERADEALYEAKHQGRNRVIARRRSRLFGQFHPDSPAS